MGLLDRVILTIYTLLLSVASLGIILLSFQLLSVELVSSWVAQIVGHWQAALVAAVFFLVSVRLLVAGMRSSQDGETIVHHLDMGDVHVSLAAIKNLVERTARHTRGVRGVKVAVQHDGQALKVRLKAVVSPESNVPSVTADMQKRIHDYIQNTVGIELADIQILVDNISNEFKSKQRVE